MILTDGMPRDCKARPERGGKLFASVVLAWLRNDAVFSPIIMNGHKVQEMHEWRVTVAENARALGEAKQAASQLQSARQPPSSEEPSGSSDPVYPTVYVGTGQRGSVSVDCLIGTDGHAADCHTLQSSGGPKFVDAVMQWLGKPENAFPADRGERQKRHRAAQARCAIYAVSSTCKIRVTDAALHTMRASPGPGPTSGQRDVERLPFLHLGRIAAIPCIPLSIMCRCCLHELSNLAHRIGVPTVATGDVLHHAPDRRILQDIVACICEGWHHR